MLVVDGEELEQLRQVSRDDVEVAFVTDERDGQRGQVGPVIAPPEGVVGSGAGGVREGNEPAQELRVLRPGAETGIRSVLVQFEPVRVEDPTDLWSSNALSRFSSGMGE